MKQNGFTLIEWLICFAVCSILVCISFASWIQLRQKNEQQLLIAEIKTAIHYAKLQAMSHGSSLMLSPQASNQDWSKGIKVMKGHQLMHQWNWQNSNWDLRWQGAGGTNHIMISGSVSHAISNGRFILTNKNTQEQVILVLNRIGRIKQL